MKKVVAVLLALFISASLSCTAIAEYTDSETILAIQQALTDLGIYKGNISGIKGNATEAAIRVYQQLNGLTVNGQINDDLLNSLGLLSEPGEITLVSSIVLSEESVLLSLNSSFVLKYAVEPKNASNKSVEWFSSDESIAIVSDGKVIAKGIGVCSIICHAKDESGVETSCRVFVAENIPNGEKGTCGDEAFWTLDSNGTLTIIGLGDMTDYETNYKPPYAANQITRAIINNGITGIGNQAFWFCNKLTSIAIPETVTKIGYSCFTGCENLESISIPESVKIIGENIFSGCVKLSEIKLPNTLKEIPRKCFYMCNGLSTIILPEELKTIGWSAFSQCKSLKTIIIPNGVTSIGDYAFSDCKSLTNVTIPASVKTIGNDAFSNSSLVTLYVYENSAAHKFAVKNNIAYILIDK